jgi:putative ABC transport system ATP-binding protein
MAETPSLLPPAGQPVVRLMKVHHAFGSGETRSPVLVDIDLEVMPGEIVILSGPSGCGKTTLLTLLGGLRTLQEGDIEVWDGKNGAYRSLRGLGEDDLVEVRKSIGFIFQRHNLLDSLTATQNVRMARNLRENANGSDADIAELLTFLGLREKMDLKPAGLSGGQRQRVAVARALVNRPRLVLADEPTAALDEVSGELVVTLLQHLARDRDDIPERFDAAKRALLAKLTGATAKGCTSVIVTHDSRIMNEADRIVEMGQGRIRSNVVVAERLFVYNGLRKCPAFAALLPETIYDLADKVSIKLHPSISLGPERLRQTTNVEAFAPGTFILRQGDSVSEGSRFYLIREGQVEIRQDLGEGEKVLGQLGPQQCFGDRALVKREPRNATVVAVGRVVAYAFSFGELWHSLERSLADVGDFIQRFEAVYGQSAARQG